MLQTFCLLHAVLKQARLLLACQQHLLLAGTFGSAAAEAAVVAGVVNTSGSRKNSLLVRLRLFIPLLKDRRESC